MSGEKLSARQKMIGMMYLVLTALLALNVSKSILDAFVNIEENIQRHVLGVGLGKSKYFPKIGHAVNPNCTHIRSILSIKSERNAVYSKRLLKGQ